MGVLTTLSAPDRDRVAIGPDRAGHAWKAATLAVFAGWLLIVGAHHEPWADESQAWLIARDSGLVQLLSERVRYEGTPGLWHLLLWLCIRGGLPFAGLHMVSVACALIGAALLLWRSPFPAALRILLIASYFCAYQYAVIARSYALDLVLLPALASLFARRTTRPIAYGALVGLLANCNAHSFVLAAALGGEWLIALIRADRLQSSIVGLGIAVALGLCALLTAWQPADNGFLLPEMQASPIATGLRFFREAFVDRPVFWSAQAPSPIEQLLGVAISLLLVIPSLALFRRAGVLPLLLVMTIALIGFSVLTYANAWHSGMLFLVWIFGLWIAWPALPISQPLGRAVIATLAIVGIVQAAEAARAGIWDIAHPYSGAERAAQALADWRAGHVRSRIAVAGFKAFAVQPYFTRNIFGNYQRGAPEPSYIVWTRGERWHPFATVSEANAAIASRYDALLMSTHAVKPLDLSRFEQNAAARGYRIAGTYPGKLEWKGYASEDDTLLFFDRPRMIRR